MQTINPDKNKTVYTFPLTTVEWKIDTPRRRDLIEVLDDRLFRISDDRHSLVELINDIGYCKTSLIVGTERASFCSN